MAYQFEYISCVSFLWDAHKFMAVY